MSRESKIGLLVATAFILVVGLLLSDHVTVATRQPPAPLTGSVRGIESSLTTPGGQQISLPAEPEKQAFVYDPTAEPEAGRIDIRIGHAPEPRPTLDREPTHTEPIWDNPPTMQAVEQVQPTQVATVEQLAAEQGEPVETVQAEPQVNVVDTRLAAATMVDRPVGVIEYKAKSGDTLGHLAARAFGRSTSDNNAKIVALNPSLADDPNLIVAGRTYRLPADAKEAAAIQVPTVREPVAKTYTVREGDNLWQIAARQLGNGNRHTEIVKLNPALNDPNALQPGMTLKLPS